MNSAHVRIFQSQDILCPSTEPQCITTSTNLFWVALEGGTIRAYAIREMGKEGLMPCWEFKAIYATVEGMWYHEDMRRLVTLETHKEQRICRIYHLFWDVKQLRTMIKPYTFPVKDVRLVSLDTVLGTVVMTAGNGCITLWKNIDDPVAVLKIHTGWNIKCLTIYGNYLGYASDVDVRIMHLKTPAPKPIDDENSWCVFWGVNQVEADEFVEVRFNSDTLDLVPSAATKTFVPPQNITKRKKDNNLAYDVIGETPNVDHPTFVNKNYFETCTNLLHKHYIGEEEPRSIHFIRNLSQKSQYEDDSAGMRLVITTSNRGNLYELSQVNLISEFEFTNQMIVSAVNDVCLFGATAAGLEVWSLGGSCVLLRSHPFIGLKNLSATKQHVVLLSKFKSDESVSIAAYYNPQTSEAVLLSDMRQVDKLAGTSNRITSLLPIFSGRRRKNEKVENPEDFFSYNVYILDTVQLCEIYEDLVDQATNVLDTDPERHIKFMREAHNLLQCKYYSLLEEDRHCQDTVSKLRINIELHNYTILLQRSFGTLGDVYAKINSEVSAQCYTQSDRSLIQVVESLQLKPQALLQYLRVVLFKQTPPFILHDEPTGNKIIELFAKFAPTEYSKVLLESLTLQSFSRTLAVQLLEEIHSGTPNWWMTRPKDAFLLGVLLLDTKDEQRAHEVFSSMEHQLIVDFVIQFRTRVFLREEPLSQFLKKYFPLCLIEILVRLYDGTTEPLTLFDGKYQLFYLCAILVKTGAKQDPMFYKICEQLFYTFIHAKEETIETTDDEEWLTFLAYCENLKKYRLEWLDDCTPFQVHQIVNEESDNEGEMDETELSYEQKSCIQVQSLLCFLLSCCPPELFEQFLKDIPNDFLGAFSLRVLCLVGAKRLDEAIDLIVSDNQAVNGLFAFGLEHCKSFENWVLVANKLAKSLKEPNENARQAYEHVLWHLASVTEPSQFLTVLPMDGNIRFYERFITHSYSSEVARQLQLQIK